MASMLENRQKKTAGEPAVFIKFRKLSIKNRICKVHPSWCNL